MKTLLILPTLVLTRNENGKYQITKKFVKGVVFYKHYWKGEIKVLMRVSDNPNSNLDVMDVNFDDLPFQLAVIHGEIKEDDLKSSSLVLVSATYQNNNVSEICQKMRIPCIYITEYSLKTIFQIIKTNRVNLIIKFRRILWSIIQDLKLKKAIKMATGLQCNGTPTFEAYKDINQNPMLYFDNRMPLAKYITIENLKDRLSYLDKDKPIRLAFSGRLNEMKGADHLIKVALQLRKNKTLFSLDIFGSGALQDEMQKEIIRHNLGGLVSLKGVLEFESELLPRIQNTVDLFVCCHRQGDPSCTYIETLACGVPIVGYANEAFFGMSKLADIGFHAPMDNYVKLAEIISLLDKDRQKLKVFAVNALEFAKEHSVENVFLKRIEHLDRILLNQN